MREKNKHRCMNKEAKELVTGQVSEQEKQTAFHMLGFRPRTATRFYADGVVQFYLETIRSLKEKEKALLTDALKVFVEYMETIRADGWSACDQGFWEKLLSFSYLDLSYEQTTEKTRFFYQTMVNWVNWLSARQIIHEEIRANVETLANSIEEPVLAAVQFLDTYQQKIDQPFLSSYGEVKRQALLEEEGDAPLSEGLFVVTKQMDLGCEVTSLLKSQTFEVLVPADLRSSLDPDMSFIGVLKQHPTGQWEILVLDRVFPAVALPFVKKQV